jgi:hypothetical protein
VQYEKYLLEKLENYKKMLTKDNYQTLPLPQFQKENEFQLK